MIKTPFRAALLLAGVGLVLSLGACSGFGDGDIRRGVPSKDRGAADPSNISREEWNKDRIFANDGVPLFGGGEKRRNDGSSSGTIGVNSFLWRATLDTVSFMPVNSADPFGGVVITDWYAPPETPGERFKMNVYIIGTALRADGVRVALFRQVAAANNTWRDAQIEEGANRKLEDAILTRARQLRNEMRATEN